MKYFATLADKDKFIQILKEFGSTLLFFLLFLVGIGFLLNWQLPHKQTYACDMENVVQWKNKPHFLHQGRYFKNGKLQTDEQAHSGQYSLKTGAIGRFGLTHNYDNLTGNELITITVWRYNKSSKNGKIVMSIPKILWESAAKIIEKSADGWEKIQLTQTIPKEAKNKSLTIYLWNPSEEIVYFDDFEVQIVQKEEM